MSRSNVQLFHWWAPGWIGSRGYLFYLVISEYENREKNAVCEINRIRSFRSYITSRSLIFNNSLSSCILFNVLMEEKKIKKEVINNECNLVFILFCSDAGTVSSLRSHFKIIPIRLCILQRRIKKKIIHHSQILKTEEKKYRSLSF